MTASRGMVFGLQCAPGEFSYISEVATAILREAFGVYARMFVDDLVVVERPDPETFFKETEEEEYPRGL